MVRRERYLATKDVMTVLSVSKGKALEIMHGFEGRGLLKKGRLLRVKESAFNEWLKRYGG